MNWAKKLRDALERHRPHWSIRCCHDERLEILSWQRQLHALGERYDA